MVDERSSSRTNDLVLCVFSHGLGHNGEYYRPLQSQGVTNILRYATRWDDVCYVQSHPFIILCTFTSGVPAQGLYSSLDLGSKLGGLSPIAPETDLGVGLTASVPDGRLKLRLPNALVAVVAELKVPSWAWCGCLAVSSRVVLVTRPESKITRSVANTPRADSRCEVNDVDCLLEHLLSYTFILCLDELGVSF
ncbi:hypothetical protein TNCV_2069221 [Trichonephila clavipes]|uniref:Uncharacterized protein n=1 Tax=Trichonephila clavipes TaxID=2585209 RepID=A0A8X7BEA4_TRICX|nr:hypothetical protein TNCV_2069221 [Trichonephila clavipes]